jgi:hypothetical protein
MASVVLASAGDHRPAGRDGISVATDVIFMWYNDTNYLVKPQKLCGKTPLFWVRKNFEK